jgi:hypothetical protein
MTVVTAFMLGAFAGAALGSYFALRSQLVNVLIGRGETCDSPVASGWENGATISGAAKASAAPHIERKPAGTAPVP